MDMSEYKIIECSVHEQSCFQLVVQYLVGGLSVVVAGGFRILIFFYVLKVLVVVGEEGSVHHALILVGPGGVHGLHL